MELLRNARLEKVELLKKLEAEKLELLRNERLERESEIMGKKNRDNFGS